MQFWKMNGAGNDFIISAIWEGCRRIAFRPGPAAVRAPRLSIRADGLMVVERPQSGGDYRMLFYNSDGSAGEMCGNGARCICRYGYEISEESSRGGDHRWPGHRPAHHPAAV